MTLLTRLLLMFLPFTILAQKPVRYEIRGTIKNFTVGQRVYFLHFQKHTAYTDSVILTTGQFVFKGETTISFEPEENYRGSVATLYIDHSGKGIDFRRSILNQRYDLTRVYLEPGLTVIKTTDSARTAQIIPPRQNDGHYTLDSIYSAYFKKINRASLEAKKQGLSSGKLVDFYEQHSQIYLARQTQDLWQFIKKHPSSPVSLYILKHLDNYCPDYDQIAPYFNALATKLKNTVFGMEYKVMLQNLKNTRIGASAPNFTMNNEHNQPVSLSSFKGKYVLINFWASWCGEACRLQNLFLGQTYQRFKTKGFTILSVSIEKDGGAWVRAIRDGQLKWTQVSDLKLWDNTAAKLYTVTAVPTNFLVDPKGRIIAKNLFSNQLSAKLQRIFYRAVSTK